MFCNCSETVRLIFDCESPCKKSVQNNVEKYLFYKPGQKQKELLLGNNAKVSTQNVSMSSLNCFNCKVLKWYPDEIRIGLQFTECGFQRQ